MTPLPNSKCLHTSSTLPGVTNHANIIPISTEDTQTVTRLSETVLVLGSSEELKSFDTEKGALFFFFF